MLRFNKLFDLEDVGSMINNDFGKRFYQATTLCFSLQTYCCYLVNSVLWDSTLRSITKRFVRVVRIFFEKLKLSFIPGLNILVPDESFKHYRKVRYFPYKD